MKVQAEFIESDKAKKTKRILLREGIILGIAIFFIWFFSSIYNHLYNEGRSLFNSISYNEIETIKKQITAQEKMNFASTCNEFSGIFFILYIIYLIIRLIIWLRSSRRNSDIKFLKVKSKEMLQIAIRKDTLVKVILILGILYLSILLLKSCGFVKSSREVERKPNRIWL